MPEKAADMTSQNKFERKLPDDRRKHLIDATLRCLSQEGQEGMSVRKISSAAGISIGLISHHYANKEELIAQAYETLTVSLLDAAKEAAELAGPGAREQLSAMLKSMFNGPMLDPGTLRCWLVFWGMMQDGNALKKVHDNTYGDHRAFVETLLKGLASEYKIPFLDTRLAAIGLLALVDGLWIEWCLDQRSFTADEAFKLCEAWIDALVIRAAPARRVGHKRTR